MRTKKVSQMKTTQEFPKMLEIRPGSQKQKTYIVIMKVIELTPKELDLKQFKKRTALEKDASTLIQEDTLITVDGKPRILYCKCKDNTDAMRWAVKIERIRKVKKTREFNRLNTEENE